MTKIEIPNTPSQTINTINIIKKYDSLTTFIKIKIIKINKINIKNSRTKSIFKRCFRLTKNIKLEIKNINIKKKLNKIISVFII